MKTKSIFILILVIVGLGEILSAQSKIVKEDEAPYKSMTNPESLVKNFIEDYFQWNNESFRQMSEAQTAEKTSLSESGYNEPLRPEQLNNPSKYIEIKGKYAAEYVKLLNQIDVGYDKLIKKYCRPNHQRLNSAFGGNSSHHPEKETIVSVNTDSDKSIVKTQNVENFGNTKLISDYEFHLTYENDRWYLEQIFYVNDEGRYESL